MSFADQLKKARKKAGFTQKELAEKCGLATGTIQQYELGKRTPVPEAIAKIAIELNLGCSYTKDGEPYFYDLQEHSINKRINDVRANLNISSDGLFTGSDIIAEIIEEALEKEQMEEFSNRVRKNLPKDLGIPTANNISLLLDSFSKLNDLGKSKAIDQVELLTKIPEYRKDNE